MARTFPQPEKKETPTQKLKRELAEVEAQRDGYQREASSLRQQINGRLEETDSYKNLVKQVDALTLDRNTAIKQRDRYKAQLQERDAELIALKDQLNAALTAQNALKADFNALREQFQTKSIEAAKTTKNPFGAGRKRSYTAQLDQIIQLRESGSSIRAIASELDIPFATVARYIRENESK